MSGNLHGGLVGVLGDEVSETFRARDIGALPDIREEGVGTDRECFEPAHPEPGLEFGNGSGWKVCDSVPDRFDVGRYGAATATHDVDEAGLGEFPDDSRHDFRRFVVLPEGVRKSGVRVTTYGHIRDLRQLLQVGSKLVRPEGTVEPHG